MKKEKNDNYSNKMPGNLKKESLFTYLHQVTLKETNNYKEDIMNMCPISLDWY